MKKQMTWNDMVLVAEAYLGRELRQNEIEMLIYFKDRLGFSYELVDCLGSYCMDTGKYSFLYMQKVAEHWHKKGIRTVEDARNLIIESNGNNQRKEDGVAAMTEEICFEEMIQDFEECIAGKITDKEKIQIKQIMEKHEHTPRDMFVLLEYVLIKNDMKLPFPYLDKIAEKYSKKNDRKRAIREKYIKDNPLIERIKKDWEAERTRRQL